MSIVELPSEQPVPEQSGSKKENGSKRAEKDKGKRKLSETPSMIDPEMLSKKSTRQSTTPVPTTPVPMDINENAVYERGPSPRSGKSTPKATRKRREGAKTPITEVEPAEPLVAQMTPEVQRKPPKPKHKEDVDESNEPAPKPVVKKREPRRERNVKTPDPSREPRRERNVKTPDPTFDDEHTKHTPAERPMTPRSARAPSPEDRPLVVPLPPPRVQDIPLPPVRGESLERPSAQQSPQVKHSTIKSEGAATVAPLPPPRPIPPVPPKLEKVEEVAPKPSPEAIKAMRRQEEDERFQKQLDATISPDQVKVVTLSQPVDEVKSFDIFLPTLVQAKEDVRNSGLFTTAIQVPKPTTSIQPEVKNSEPRQPKMDVTPLLPQTTTTSLTRQEQAEDIIDDISKKKPSSVKSGVLNNDQIMKENAIGQPEVKNSEPRQPKMDVTPLLPQTTTTSLTRQEQAENIIEDISKKKPSSVKPGVLDNDQIMKENAIGQLIDSSAQGGQEQKTRIGSKPGQESQHKENRDRHKQAETMSQGKADNQMNTFNNMHEQTIDDLPSQKLPTTAAITIPSRSEANKDNSVEMGNSPSTKADDNSRSLINSLPKPFKVNNIPNDSLNDEQPQTHLSESNESMTAQSASEPKESYPTAKHDTALLMNDVKAALKEVKAAEEIVRPKRPMVEVKQIRNVGNDTIPTMEVKPIPEVKPTVEMKPSMVVKPTIEIMPTTAIKPNLDIHPIPEFKSKLESKPMVEIKPKMEVKPSVVENASVEVKATENTGPVNEVKSTPVPAPITEVIATLDVKPIPEVKPVMDMKPMLKIDIDKKDDTSSSSPSPLAMHSVPSTPPKSDSPQTVPLHLRQRPEKRDNRDSKVIKAASYWNNYIGEVLDKKKPPENLKSLEKPKKISSAGIGNKGYNDIKSAFEFNRSGNPLSKTPEESSSSNIAGTFGGMQRRNSRKIPVEGCNPGLKVSDAKSAFEQKTQPATPVIFRRNSSTSNGKESDELVTSGPNIIKKKVPEFPPPPISKMPFGANRRAGALSPLSGTLSPTPRSNSTLPGNYEVSTPVQNGIKQETDKATVSSPPTNNDKEASSKVIDIQPPKKATEPKPLMNGEIIGVNNAENITATSTTPSNKSIDTKKESSKMDTKNQVPLREKGPVLSNKSISTEDGPNHITSKAQTPSNTINSALPTKPLHESNSKDEQPKITKNIKIEKALNDEISPSPKTVKKTISIVKDDLPAKQDEVVTMPSSKLIGKNASKEVRVSKDENPVYPKHTDISSIKTEKNILESKSVPENKQKTIEIKSIKPQLTPLAVEESNAPEIKSVQNQPLSPRTPTGVNPSIKPQLTPSAVEESNTPEIKSVQYQPLSPRTPTGVKPPEFKSIPIQPIAPARTAPIKVEIESSVPSTTQYVETTKPSVPSTKQYVETSKPSAPTTKQYVETTKPSVETTKPSMETNRTEKSTAPHRIIPIQIEHQGSDSRPSGLTSPLPTASQLDNSNSQEHHIPIHVEGKGTMINRLNSTEDSAEGRDSFSTNSLSRRRFGSRKKRSSYAYSDSSSVTGDDEQNYTVENLDNGLKKYTSIGKGTGGGIEPMFRLRKTKPPFAAQRSDSFSSGEEDDFDDDGYREMTAENLFSTLLTRVKSLTRRIHDDEDPGNPAGFQQNNKIVNHRLNPGGTHARLERSALRSSLKRNNSNTPSALSRQSSQIDASLRPSMRDETSYEGGYDDGTSSMRSYGSSGVDGGFGRSSIQRGIKDQNETDSVYSIGSLRTEGGTSNKGKHEHEQQQQQQQIMNRFDLEKSKNAATESSEAELGSNVSVTSKQRLRPGYLPPPSLLASDSDPTDNRIENALSESSSMKNIGQNAFRKIPINMERGMSSASLASGPSQSDILETISEKGPASRIVAEEAHPKRHSRVLIQDSSAPKEQLPWAKPSAISEEQKTKSPYKMVQMKRLSVGLDLDNDDKSTASNSSGYISSQHHPDAVMRRHKEGQLPSSKPLTLERQSTMPSTFQTASFTASNSSSVASNMNVGPPVSVPVKPPPPTSPPPCLPVSPPPPPPGPLAPSVQLSSSPNESSVILNPVKTSQASSSPMLTQPIYTPFKTPNTEAPSQTSNPFQTQKRKPSVKPYLQIALVQDRRYKNQAQNLAAGVKDSTDSSDANLGNMVVDNSKGSNRRTILPYGGAKSDGAFNKHAFISCNVIAAAERRKRDSYSRSSTTELPLEKVIDHLIDFPFLPCCSLYFLFLCFQRHYMHFHTYIVC